MSSNYAGGSDSASSSNQEEQTLYLAVLANVVSNFIGLLGDEAIRTYLVAANPVPLASNASSAFAGADTPPGQVVWIAGHDRIDVGTETPVWALATAAHQVGPYVVDQGAPAAIDKPWSMILSDGIRQTGTERSPIVAMTPHYGRTSFGQVRIANQERLFEDNQDYELDTRLWSTRVVGAGTVAYDTTSGLTAMNVSGASGDVAEIATHTFFPYEPGATSHTVITLKHLDIGQTNQTREWGFGTQDDVYMFRLVGTALRLVVRSSSSGTPTDTHVIEQADWNLDPMLDGTGPSGRTLDLTMINQWEIDFQWLSAGLIRFAINGSMVHLLDLRGTISLPSTRSGQLPLRMTIRNAVASSASSMYYKCSVVYRDGGTAPRLRPGSHSLTAPKTGIGTMHTAVLAFRLVSTYLGRPMRKIVLPRSANVANASGRGTVRLYFNPTSLTVTGAWTPVALAPWLEYHETITDFTVATPPASEIFLPNTADVRSFNGADVFALHGTHLRRTYDNSSGDTILFTAAATVGNIDIVSLLATFNTLG